ncbi:SGNH/GDSL hydrolase family protein [Methylophilus methylotrophus]|uniref:SGNH/GDSL hydrolase family protein n=1 Tax=Methylophilus methylotrophus TaxID=17 RepID=UPI000F59B990|nr:SGNH/GDSL hydrolase family protein [Methylophilus methylotrophus]
MSDEVKVKKAVYAKDWETYKKDRYGPGVIDSEVMKLRFAQWHVLAEGDSWFHLNALRPQENLLQQLQFSQDTAIASLAMAGDNINQMMNPKIGGFLSGLRAKKFVEAIKYQKWDMILISGGGNDMIDAFTFADGYPTINGTKVHILRQDIEDRGFPDRFEEYLDENALQATLETITHYYSELIKLVRGSPLNAKTRIIGHTYDYFTFRNQTSKREKSVRQNALEDLKVPVTLWKSISCYLNDRLRLTLLNLADVGNDVIIVDTINALVQASPDSLGNTLHWRNEIHPNYLGYKKIFDDRLKNFLYPAE